MGTIWVSLWIHAIYLRCSEIEAPPPRDPSMNFRVCLFEEIGKMKGGYFDGNFERERGRGRRSALKKSG